MSFTKITEQELNSRGATTLPNQPQIAAQALKQEFDAPAKEIVAPKFNNLIDELEATTAAASIGMTAPTGRTGNTIQAIVDDISSDISEAVADAHTHSNKTVLDKFGEEEGEPTYDGNPIGGGGGSGDMRKSVYDSDNTVANAGGIVDYVESQAYTLPTASSEVLGGVKVGTNLSISDGVLSASYSDATTEASGLMSATDKTKLNGIENNANNYSLPMASTSTLGGVMVDGTSITALGGVISAHGSGGTADAYKTVKVGSTNVVASGEDTLELVAGSNVTLTPDASLKKVTISAIGGGQSSGDMLAADYDSDYDVKTAGGIKAYTTGITDGIYEAMGILGAKNLFSNVQEDKIIYNSYSNYYTIASHAQGLLYIEKILKNTDYTVTRESGDWFELVLLNEYPPNFPSSSPVVGLELTHDKTLSSYTFNSGNYEYVAFTPNYTDPYTLDDIKGMLKLASDTDATYRPHAETNYELTIGKADKVSSATNGDLAKLDSNGNLVDSGISASSVVTTSSTSGLIKNDGTIDTTSYVSDISGKADKVSSATNGNFAGLDSNGNLTDSGSKASDFLTQHQDISGKADKVASATNGNFAGLDSNGNLTDSGSKASDFLTQHQDISGKQDKALTTSVESQSTVEGALGALSSKKMSYADNGILGAKSLLPVIAKSGNYSNMILSVDGDGVITFSGTPTGNLPQDVFNGEVSKDYGEVIISGMANVVNATWGNIYLYDSSDTQLYTYYINSADDYTIDLADYPTVASLRVNVERTSNNVELSGKAYPMIRLATDKDATFQPHAQTNRQLTLNKMSYVDNGILGAKNLLDFSKGELSNAILSENNGIYTLTAPNSSNTYPSMRWTNTPIPVGIPVKFVLKVTGIVGTTRARMAIRNGGTLQEYVNITGAGTYKIDNYTANEGDYVGLYVRYNQAGSAANESISFEWVMMTLATDTDDTHQPFAKTNIQLTVDKAETSVIAPVEDGTTVQKSGGYAVGSHAIRNGAFITWKNAKAQGETINDASDYDSGDVASVIDTVTTGAANTPHTSITLDTRNQVFKNNKLVITRVQFAVTMALTGNYTDVFVLPYAPINNCYINFQLIDIDNNVVVNNRTGITSIGSVRIYGSLATGNYQIVGTYFTN